MGGGWLGNAAQDNARGLKVSKSRIALQASSESDGATKGAARTAISIELFNRVFKQAWKSKRNGIAEELHRQERKAPPPQLQISKRSRGAVSATRMRVDVTL
ncbi:hypothetical protein CAOG_010237, partial [Capsaspora owczarzaki ATCC 30864]